MTREEAIKWFEENPFYHKDHEPFNMAIKALSQEPCDDTISREDAIKALQNVVCISAAIKSRMVGAIEELPSVTQKSGKWIDYRDDGFVECPFCGHATNCEDNIDELHYCFYCGACMKDGRTLDEFIEDNKESEE